MSLYLGPILDGVVLNGHPPHVGYKIIHHEYHHETPAFYIQTNRVNFRFRFTLEWRESIVTETMWYQLKTILNKNIIYTFRPFPDRYYESVYEVKIIGGLNALQVFRYIGQGYQGSLVLETYGPILESPEWVETEEELEVEVIEDEGEEDEPEVPDAELDLGDSLFSYLEGGISTLRTIRWENDGTLVATVPDGDGSGYGSLIKLNTAGEVLESISGDGGYLSFSVDGGSGHSPIGPSAMVKVGDYYYIHTNQKDSSVDPVYSLPVIVRTNFAGDWSYFGVPGTSDGSEVGVFPNGADAPFFTMEYHEGYFYMKYVSSSTPHGGILKFSFDGSFWEFKHWVGDGLLTATSVKWVIGGFTFGEGDDLYIRYGNTQTTPSLDQQIFIKTNWEQTIFEVCEGVSSFTGGAFTKVIYRNNYFYIHKGSVSTIIKTQWDGVNWQTYEIAFSSLPLFMSAYMDLRFGYLVGQGPDVPFTTDTTIKLFKESVIFP